MTAEGDVWVLAFAETRAAPAREPGPRDAGAAGRRSPAASCTCSISAAAATPDRASMPATPGRCSTRKRAPPTAIATKIWSRRSRRRRQTTTQRGRRRRARSASRSRTSSHAASVWAVASAARAPRPSARGQRPAPPQGRAQSDRGGGSGAGPPPVAIDPHGHFLLLRTLNHCGLAARNNVPAAVTPPGRSRKEHRPWKTSALCSSSDSSSRSSSTRRFGRPARTCRRSPGGR